MICARLYVVFSARFSCNRDMTVTMLVFSRLHNEASVSNFKQRRTVE